MHSMHFPVSLLLQYNKKCPKAGVGGAIFIPGGKCKKIVFSRMADTKLKGHGRIKNEVWMLGYQNGISGEFGGKLTFPGGKSISTHQFYYADY